MSNKVDQLQPPSSPVVEVSLQYPALSPCVELAKQIMDSPVCEINIIDYYYQHIERSDADESSRRDPLYYDTIRKNGIYEIEDLKTKTQYEDHLYVTDPFHYRYYCGVKLTTSKGVDVGSICVLDTRTKRASNMQKKQFGHLALVVMNIIEYERRNRSIASKMEAYKESFHKINHDLRTPISGIVSVADLLVEKEHQDGFPDQELKMIKESAETIINLVDNVLEDLDTDNKDNEKPKQNYLGDIVEQLKRLYHPPAKVKGLSLTFDNRVDSGIKLSNSFSIKLLQAISNLVSNAVKFTPENGSIEVTMSREEKNNKNTLQITVSDSGNNMSAEQVRAFNNGKSVARSSGTNGEQSFGVGLKFVKQLVDKAGGTIFVENSENTGTQFSILLPVSEEQTGESRPSFRAAPPKTMSNGTERTVQRDKI